MLGFKDGSVVCFARSFVCFVCFVGWLVGWLIGIFGVEVLLICFVLNVVVFAFVLGWWLFCVFRMNVLCLFHFACLSVGFEGWLFCFNGRLCFLSCLALDILFKHLVLPACLFLNKQTRKRTNEQTH